MISALQPPPTALGMISALETSLMGIQAADEGLYNFYARRRVREKNFWQRVFEHQVSSRNLWKADLAIAFGDVNVLANFEKKESEGDNLMELAVHQNPMDEHSKILIQFHQHVQ